jgi:hypothetical protein
MRDSEFFFLQFIHIVRSQIVFPAKNVVFAFVKLPAPPTPNVPML